MRKESGRLFSDWLQTHRQRHPNKKLSAIMCQIIRLEAKSLHIYQNLRDSILGSPDKIKPRDFEALVIEMLLHLTLKFLQ